MRNQDSLFLIPDGWYKSENAGMVKSVAIMNKSCVAWADINTNPPNVFSIRKDKLSGSVLMMANHPCIDDLGQFSTKPVESIRGWRASQFEYLGSLKYLGPLAIDSVGEWDNYFEWSE